MGTGREVSDHCGVFVFAVFGEFERLGAFERFLVVLRERREYLLSPAAAFE